MTTTATSLVTDASIALQDSTFTRWTQAELLRYLNMGQRVLITTRPDQCTKQAALPTVAGARQTLPAEALSLVDIVSNTAAPKRNVRKVSLASLDSVNRDWLSTTQATVFLNYCYDLKDPRVYWVYPPSAGSGGSVDAIYSYYPADMLISDNLTVPDVWAHPLLNYVLGRAYAKDAEYGGNAQLAAQYMAAFASEAGGQATAAGAVAPQM